MRISCNLEITQRVSNWPCLGAAEVTHFLHGGPISIDSLLADLAGKKPDESLRETAPHIYFKLLAEWQAGRTEQEWPPGWRLLLWLSASGLTVEEQVAESLMTKEQIAEAATNEPFQKKLTLIKAKYFGEDLAREFDAAAPRALAHAKRIINGEVEATPATRWDASKWVMEKATGKPKQDVTVGGEFSILHVLRQLEDRKKEQLESPTQIKDVTPVREKSWEEQWVTENVPTPRKEKSE